MILDKWRIAFFFLSRFSHHDSGKNRQLNKIACNLLEVLTKFKLLQSVNKMYSIFNVLSKNSYSYCHTELPRRLAHSGPVAGGFNITQVPPPQPLGLPGAQGQLWQEHTVTQPTSFVPGYNYRLNADDSNCRKP